MEEQVLKSLGDIPSNLPASEINGKTGLVRIWISDTSNNPVAINIDHVVAVGRVQIAITGDSEAFRDATSFLLTTGHTIVSIITLEQALVVLRDAERKRL